jgi:hypothetical protein
MTRAFRSGTLALSADALTIVAQAEARLADEYTAVQKAGQVAGPSDGYRKKASSAKDAILPTAQDVGLTRKQVHEGRKLAAAEAASMLPRSGDADLATTARKLGLSPDRVHEGRAGTGRALFASGTLLPNRQV